MTFEIMRLAFAPIVPTLLLVSALGRTSMVHAQAPNGTVAGKPTVQDLLAWYACGDTTCMSMALRPRGYVPSTVGPNSCSWFPDFEHSSLLSNEHGALTKVRVDQDRAYIVIPDDHFIFSNPADKDSTVRLSCTTHDPTYAKVLQKQLRALGWEHSRLSSHWHSYTSPTDATLGVAIRRSYYLYEGSRSKIPYWELHIKHYPIRARR